MVSGKRERPSGTHAVPAAKQRRSVACRRSDRVCRLSSSEHQDELVLRFHVSEGWLGVPKDSSSLRLWARAGTAGRQ